MSEVLLGAIIGAVSAMAGAVLQHFLMLWRDKVNREAEEKKKLRDQLTRGIDDVIFTPSGKQQGRVKVQGHRYAPGSRKENGRWIDEEREHGEDTFREKPEHPEHGRDTFR